MTNNKTIKNEKRPKKNNAHISLRAFVQSLWHIRLPICMLICIQICMPTRDVARGFEDARTFSQYCEKCEERAPENIGSITPYSECEASKV